MAGFPRCGYPCPDKYNPADHYVHSLAIFPGDEENSSKRVRDIGDKFLDSDDGKVVKAVIDFHKDQYQLQQEGGRKQKYQEGGSVPTNVTYKATSWTQFKALFHRGWLSSKKEPWMIKISVSQTLVLALLIGLVFLDQELDQEGARNMTGAIVMVIINVSFGYPFTVSNVYCSELGVVLREHFNGAYRLDLYFFARQIAELPVLLALPIAFITIGTKK